MTHLGRYPTTRLRTLAVAALIALALAVPATSAFALSSDARPDGGSQATAAGDPYAAPARPDGGVELQSAGAAGGGDSGGGGADWEYFAIGGFVVLLLAGTYVLVHRHRVHHPAAPTPAH